MDLSPKLGIMAIFRHTQMDRRSYSWDLPASWQQPPWAAGHRRSRPFAWPPPSPRSCRAWIKLGRRPVKTTKSKFKKKIDHRIIINQTPNHTKSIGPNVCGFKIWSNRDWNPRNASALLGMKLCRNQMKATSAVSPWRTNLHKPGLGLAWDHR